MADILIRDVPDDVIAAIDAKAKRTGLSRVEYLRRQLIASTPNTAKVTVEDLARSAEVFADAKDPEVVKQAWR